MSRLRGGGMSVGVEGGVRGTNVVLQCTWGSSSLNPKPLNPCASFHRYGWTDRFIGR